MNSQQRTSFMSATSTNYSQNSSRLEMMVTGSSSVPKKVQTSLTDYFQFSRLPQQQQQPKKAQEAAQDGLMYFPLNDVSTKDLLENGGRANVVLNDKDVALICHKDDGQVVVYAVQGKCPHAGGPLHLGDIEDVPGCGPSIKCPWHKWTFSLKTGKCSFPGHGNVAENLETFPVKLASNGNVIKIGFKEISAKAFVTPPE